MNDQHTTTAEHNEETIRTVLAAANSWAAEADAAAIALSEAWQNLVVAGPFEGVIELHALRVHALAAVSAAHSRPAMALRLETEHDDDLAAIDEALSNPANAHDSYPWDAVKAELGLPGEGGVGRD